MSTTETKKRDVIIIAPISGHTANLAKRIAHNLNGQSIRTEQLDLHNLSHISNNYSSILILMSSVRLGKHHEHANQLLQKYKVSKRKNPLVLISVNMKAVDSKQRAKANNQYLKEWIADHDIVPALSFAVPGKIDKSHIHLHLITAIQFLSKIIPALKTYINFNAWNYIDSIAEEIGILCCRKTHQTTQYIYSNKGENRNEKDQKTSAA